MDKIILVDSDDQVIGFAPKLEAHFKGELHRAFSVLIFNSEGKLLLHRRALDKYHSPGLWTNTCCSHPSPNESVLEAAKRRLKEEMGMEADLDFAFKFTYKHAFDNGLIEHEIDHVFVGHSDVLPVINRNEVDSFKYVDLSEIEKDMIKNPDSYTVWFRIILQNYSNKLSCTYK